MSTGASWELRFLRSGSDSARDRWLDCFWLLGAFCLLVATGMGLRDPWPADEPRFALVARDMVATGDWLVPRVAGDIYADKPPLFFWLIAAGLAITGSLRVAFLLPSILAALGTTLLVYDLARRLWSRETGLIAGACLLFTVQFVWQARQAQIDATLCFWTTLSLYGLLRHLLLGPAWRWYAIGWFAAGLGVITKGVGFLPLLVLIPFAIARSEKWSPRLVNREYAKWCLLGPPLFLLAIAIWLAPMLWMSFGDRELGAYRDEILFHQTVTRYSNAWHHHEPFWYFLVQVIPGLWLPMSALVPWLIPRWRTAWRIGDLRIVLPLAWVVLVVLFFTLSSGKRGVYVLPAVPAFILACAPFIREVASKRVADRVMFVVAAFVAGITSLAAVVMLLRDDLRQEVIDTYTIDPLGPLATLAVVTILLCAGMRRRSGLVAYAGVILTVLLVVSFWINPAMNSARSGARFTAMIERVVDANAEVGIIGFKEQYMLQLRMPITHFGHARWREAQAEASDAARWLAEQPNRQLIVPESAMRSCFEESPAKLIGSANDIDWYLVTKASVSTCAARGNEGVAILYRPPLAAAPQLESATNRISEVNPHPVI
jgi:4-amino-4-deoxy-L-arabinose transferase-like glycosyltransferase